MFVFNFGLMIYALVHKLILFVHGRFVSPMAFRVNSFFHRVSKQAHILFKISHEQQRNSANSFKSSKYSIYVWLTLHSL